MCLSRLLVGRRGAVCVARRGLAVGGEKGRERKWRKSRRRMGEEVGGEETLGWGGAPL